MSTSPKVWCAWSCHLSRLVVEPVYQYLKNNTDIDCTLAPRGAYSDLADRMKGYSHYVFGVGPDISWDIAKRAGLIGINIQHGQYVLGTWRSNIPDHVVLTGSIYADELRQYPSAEHTSIYTPGYMHVDILNGYTPSEIKDIRCLIVLPKVEEHCHLPTRQSLIVLSKKLGRLNNVVVRIHPRNSSFASVVKEIGYTVDTNKTFYESLARARCVLSGPSNCIIESCALGVPVGLFATTLSDETFDAKILKGQMKYLELLTNTYEPICNIFGSIKKMSQWVIQPTAKPKGNALSYWSNIGSTNTSVINCVGNILTS